ncbi:hypothetical protein DS843_13745 [Roseomonas genomospecies 6]|uniref:Uncharacterized protein n=1 Tax=Roseomonas genomospecies 6 TaxID=214106 RepID=A0A9W7NJB2_9PROT|nr:hypothetical protein DS843_13745 [Roseomonas genomospecies 6]
MSELISAAVDRMAKEHPVYYIIQDAKIIHECAARASVTLREYNMSGEGAGSDDPTQPVALPNFYKEAGHFAYWITRLKPLRLVNFTMISETLNRLGITHDAAALDAVKKRAQRRDLVLLLNEYAAYHVAKSIIYRSEDALFNMTTSGQPAESVSATRSEFRRLRQRSMERAMGLSTYLLNSLRYDTHSPNSLALLLEALLGSGYPFPQVEPGA